MSQFKDLFLILAGFALLQIIYFLQSDGLLFEIYFIQPMAIYVLSTCCYVLFLLKGRSKKQDEDLFLRKDHGVEEDPKEGSR
jgi:hypothetical protein